MKTLFILAIILVTFTSCKKLQDTPTPVTKPITDTVPDNSSAHIQLFVDSVQTDETDLVFNKTSSFGYNPNEDARYLQGFGLVSMSSLIGNDPMAINTQPFSESAAIRLRVSTRNDGAFGIKISRLDMPAHIAIWLKDKTLRDSVDLRQGNYHFNILHSDTTTFGTGRFEVYFKHRD